MDSMIGDADRAEIHDSVVTPRVSADRPGSMHTVIGSSAAEGEWEGEGCPPARGASALGSRAADRAI